MPVVKVSEATGQVLDWMVASCENTLGRYVQPNEKRGTTKWEVIPQTLRYSTNYLHGSPIIDREFIVTAEHREVGKTEGGVEFDRIVGWKAHVAGRCYWSTVKVFYGRTHLIAAMRAYVASKLGHEVEVPDELFR